MDCILWFYERIISSKTIPGPKRSTLSPQSPNAIRRRDIADKSTVENR